MTLLHAHDYGGDGPPLVLLHGYARSLTDWDASASLLTAAHRVLAVDLPGHGRSPGVSPWTIPTVVRDIACTLDAHGLPEAVVVGHSLGGLIAVEYARANPERARARAAVNLDGFWWRPDFPGGEQVCEGLLASAGAVAPPGYIEQQVDNCVRLGIPADRAQTAIRAAVRPLPDGTWQTLPSRAEALDVLDELHRLGALGVTTWLDGVGCPLLLVQAGRRQPPAPGTEWFDEFSARFAQVVSGELAALSGTRPTIHVSRIDAGHPMILETPEAVATLVAEFVRELPG
ncbi:alpha/beta hydrolase [Streptomyces sp. NPDC046759]|uniref:alpha/beta fold hydrolase n=1 Tax=Streptomyces sp. NPDC046759 TaxID=3155019 RepID=UPI0033FABE4F